MEYTQEQIDKMISDAKEEAKRGLFTEEDLTRRVTSEVDRRVESGIQKGLDTHKSKWEEEYTKQANMTAEEVAKQKLDEQIKLLTTREKEIKRKANLLEAKDKLSTASIPKSHYEKFINVLISEDEESTNTNVENFINMFNQTKSEIETEVTKKYVNVPVPTGGNGDKVVTKESFNKMNYGEKFAFKQSNPEMYAQFIK